MGLGWKSKTIHANRLRGSVRRDYAGLHAQMDLGAQLSGSERADEHGVAEPFFAAAHTYHDGLADIKRKVVGSEQLHASIAYVDGRARMFAIAGEEDCRERMRIAIRSAFLFASAAFNWLLQIRANKIADGSGLEIGCCWEHVNRPCLATQREFEFGRLGSRCHQRDGCSQAKYCKTQLTNCPAPVGAAL